MKEMSLRRLELDGVDGTLGRQEGTHLELVDNLAPMLMVVYPAFMISRVTYT